MVDVQIIRKWDKHVHKTVTEEGIAKKGVISITD